MNWISVEDSLPESSWFNRILICGIPKCGSHLEKTQIQIGTYTAYQGFCFGEYGCRFEATHWMPLPEQPK